MTKLHRWKAEIEANIERAAALVGPHDPHEVAAFCARLTRSHGHDKEEAAAQLRDLRLPAGFMHVRTFDAKTGVETGGVYSTTDEPTEAIGILGCALGVVGHDARNWVSTTAMPVTRKGVLDLAIGYDVPPYVAAARGR